MTDSKPTPKKRARKTTPKKVEKPIVAVSIPKPVEEPKTLSAPQEIDYDKIIARISEKLGAQPAALFNSSISRGKLTKKEAYQKVVSNFRALLIYHDLV